MEASTQFPFMINGVVEQDIATTFFASTADFDTPTLLRLRLVSKDFRDGIDLNTTLCTADVYGQTTDVLLNVTATAFQKCIINWL